MVLHGRLFVFIRGSVFFMFRGAEVIRRWLLVVKQKRKQRN